MSRRLAVRTATPLFLAQTSTPVSIRCAQRIVPALLWLILLTFVPTQAQAQSAPSRIADALSRVVSTLTASAHSVAVAFQEEPPSVLQPTSDQRHQSAAQRIRSALIAVGGVAMVGFFLAIVVMISAQVPLEAVARAAERDVSRSFWVGLLWQALAVPILIAIAVALALTIILLPAIPIAMLAWALAYAGTVTLGLFAVALVLGRAMLGRSTSHNRGALLSSLVCGLIALTAMWVAAALFVSVPTVGILIRILALAISWVAATVGLGAVVRSRAGTSRLEIITTETAVPSWQTPTPVFGVVAARRPTPASSSTAE
jgi:hypothetical protein